MTYYNTNLSAGVNSSATANEVEKKQDISNLDVLEYKNTAGFTYHVINFNNTKYAPNEGIVEVYPAKVSKGVVGRTGNAPLRHESDVSFTVCRDQQNGMLIGIPKGFDKDGNIQFEKFNLKGTVFFDLSIPKERMKFICVKYGPFYKNSPNFRMWSKNVYDIVDKEAEASEFLKNRNLRKKATEIAESLAGEELNDFALTIGLDPKIMSQSQLSMSVIKIAEDNTRVNGKTGAQRFMDAWSSEYRTELVILKRGIGTGIVIDDGTNGINFNGLTLGYNEPEALAYLKNHQATAVSIDTQARSKQEQTISAYSKPKRPAILDDKDAAIANAKREADAMAAKAKMAEEKLQEVKSLEQIADECPELAAILEENGHIKGLHLVARTKPLDERLEAVKAKVEAFNKAKNN